MRELQQKLRELGAGLVAYADLQALPPVARANLPMGVSIAVPLRAEVIARISQGPTQEYFREYRRVNALLKEIAEEGAQWLRQQGSAATTNPATNNDDPATLSSVLPHKTVATRAGLGWIGRCALLVTEQFGSAVRLSTILTDAPLTPATPISVSRCGDCDACVRACPGSAPTGRSWQAGMMREELFDAFACRPTARSLAAKQGIDESICGICIASCPWTKRYLENNGAL